VDGSGQLQDKKEKEKEANAGVYVGFSGPLLDGVLKTGIVPRRPDLGLRSLLNRTVQTGGRKPTQSILHFSFAAWDDSDVPIIEPFTLSAAHLARQVLFFAVRSQSDYSLGSPDELGQVGFPPASTTQ